MAFHFQLSSIEAHFLVGFVLTFISGLLIGIDRGSRGAPSGVRDHTLVCMGAMLFTTLSSYVDPASTSRIAANIVTGVGFLGAGIIMYERGSIKGLTTAASVWFSAAIGMAIGFGYYFIGIFATLGAFAILRMPHLGEHGLPKVAHKKGKPVRKKMF